MDAKILGNYIATRRKELGMTQANLAEKIHVTDKAVSRWERGVGFAFLSVWIQFLDIKNLAYTGNWSAIRDTINVLSAVVIMFCIITLLLNFINIKTHD